jgi:hypothetical protein
VVLVQHLGPRVNSLSHIGTIAEIHFASFAHSFTQGYCTLDESEGFP